MIIAGLILILIIVVAVTIYINARLFAYIKKLEDKVIEQKNLNDNLFNSMQELVQNDYLLSDGRLKKFTYKDDRNKYYNGVKVDDQEVNL